MLLSTEPLYTKNILKIINKCTRSEVKLVQSWQCIHPAFKIKSGQQTLTSKFFLFVQNSLGLKSLVGISSIRKLQRV